MHQGSKYVLGLNMSGAKKCPGQNVLLSRQSGYLFVLTCYSWSLALCLGNIKTDFNQINDNLHEKSIQNALD